MIKWLLNRGVRDCGPTPTLSITIYHTPDFGGFCTGNGFVLIPTQGDPVMFGGKNTEGDDLYNNYIYIEDTLRG